MKNALLILSIFFGMTSLLAGQSDDQSASQLVWMQNIIDSIEMTTDLCTTCSIAPNIKSYITPSGEKRFRFNSVCNDLDRTTIFYNQRGTIVAQCFLNSENRDCGNFSENTSFTFARNIVSIWDCEQGINCASIESKLLFSKYDIIKRRNACSKQNMDLVVSKEFDAYEWVTPDAQILFGAKIPADISGDYQVIVTNQYGCLDTSAINVDVRENLGPPKILGESIICNKEGADISIPAYEKYEWSTGETTKGINVLLSDEYKVTVTDDLGCVDSARIIIEDHSNYQLTIRIDEDEVVIGQELLLSLDSDEINLNASEVLFWKEGERTLNSFDKELIIQVSDSTDITAAVRNEEGCVFQTTILIFPIGVARVIYFPNVLYARSDLGNDTLLPELKRNSGVVTQMHVYDRWGGLVFKAIDNAGITEGWNGQYGDNKALPGVYIYIVDIRFADGTHSQFSNSVLLIN